MMVTKGPRPGTVGGGPRPLEVLHVLWSRSVGGSCSQRHMLSPVGAHVCPPIPQWGWAKANGQPCYVSQRHERASQGCSAGVAWDHLGSAWCCLGSPGVSLGRQRLTQAEGWPPLPAVTRDSSLARLTQGHPGGRGETPKGRPQGETPQVWPEGSG